MQVVTKARTGPSRARAGPDFDGPGPWEAG